MDRPRYAGGIGEVSRIVSRAGGRVSWDALARMIARFDVSALAQRLGYLLELNRVDVPDEVRAALAESVKPGSKVLLGSRARWGTHGSFAREWSVVENVPRDMLVSDVASGRRRVVFKKGPRQ
jgi:predicted transcriptional regulator of viral defense system